MFPLVSSILTGGRARWAGEVRQAHLAAHATKRTFTNMEFIISCMLNVRESVYLQVLFSSLRMSNIKFDSL